MTSYPLLSRVCAIPPAELAQALKLTTYDALIADGDADALKRQVEADELTCFDELVDMLLRPQMRTAMEIASRHALRDVEKYRNGRGRRFRYGARLQRSVVGYSTRAAVKPSPFSHFTRIGGVADETPSVDPVLREQYQDIPTGHTVSKLTPDARSMSAAIDTIPNPTLRMVDGRLLGWRAVYVIDHGFAWRSDEIVDATAWVDPGSPDPVGALADITHTDLHLLDGTCAVIADDMPGETRELDTPAPQEPIDSTKVFGFSTGSSKQIPGSYHVVSEPREQPSLTDTAAEVDIDRWLRSRLQLSSMYRIVHEWAIAQFGSGVTVDLGEFLLRAMMLFEETPPKLELIPATGAEFADRPVLPPMSAVFWQACPAVSADTVVVNNTTGLGIGSTFRWGGPFAERGAEIATDLGHRGGFDVLPFTFGDEWNGIQTGGGHAATWPTGRFHRPTDLNLGNYQLEIHDDHMVVTKQGFPTVPLYTGAMPDHRMTGAARIFSLLGHPWAFTQDFDTEPEPQWSREITGEALVTQRAGATLTGDRIKAWSKLELHRALIELAAWTDEVGLPRACFWRAHGGSRSMRAATRKPAFVDFSSPHLVAAFLQTAVANEIVIVEEALPDSRKTTGATEEYVSLFVLEPQRSQI